MVSSQAVAKTHELLTISRDITYHADPTLLFHTLCAEKSDCLLLDSAEIESKEDLKSLMIVDSAVRITCIGHQVTFAALTANGKNMLNALKTNLHQSSVIVVDESNSLVVDFPEPDALLDEDSRLKEVSSLDALRLVQRSFDLEGHDKFALFCGGLFSYDLVANFEPLGDAEDDGTCPDYVFYVAETMLVIDHQTGHCLLRATAFDKQQASTLEARMDKIAEQCKHIKPLPAAKVLTENEVSVSVSDEDYCHTVEVMKDYIVKGDIFQVVPSRAFHLACPSPLHAYKQLKQSNPSPYMFYMQDEKFTLFGASPESALKYEKGTNQIEIYPIAGTRPRGKYADGSIDLDLDSRIELDLRTDKKENAEHMMLVDLARNDVARISEAGSRHVADLLKVDRYSHVMHLVSRVVGQLRSDLDALHAYQACMNMGTLTGAPKIRAMQLIRDVEKSRRGSYGGAVGYFTGEGDLDTCIVIRSAFVVNGDAKVQAGAGVVFDSDPQSEANETRSKAQAVISAILAAHK